MLRAKVVMPASSRRWTAFDLALALSRIAWGALAQLRLRRMDVTRLAVIANADFQLSQDEIRRQPRKRLLDALGAGQTSSTATAVASPPPMHRLATPRLRPRSLSALISVVDDARAAGADRVAERGRAAVDVDLVVRDAEVAHRDHGDAGEGLVDFEQVDVGDAPAGLVEHLLDRADRGGR